MARHLAKEKMQNAPMANWIGSLTHVKKIDATFSIIEGISFEIILRCDCKRFSPAATAESLDQESRDGP
ncbi:MAG: hypothetical protein K9G71_12180 [Rhodobacteraceae bacterium]|nr:hypothetical protein [Paracoccaceae bacterium]MCF8515112.1 hypothetical protein [Paracoccaceae bacterium]MCF8519356.1 hypothetical protein [Paracoccaceae bacterium]